MVVEVELVGSKKLATAFVDRIQWILDLLNTITLSSKLLSLRARLQVAGASGDIQVEHWAAVHLEAFGHARVHVVVVSAFAGLSSCLNCGLVRASDLGAFSIESLVLGRSAGVLEALSFGAVCVVVVTTLDFASSSADLDRETGSARVCLASSVNVQVLESVAVFLLAFSVLSIIVVLACVRAISSDQNCFVSWARCIRFAIIRGSVKISVVWAINDAC